MKNYQKLSNYIFISLFSIALIFFAIAISVFPKKNFSEKENRPLSEFPTASLQNIIEGDFFDRRGDFYSDNFPFRDFFTSVHTVSELSLGKTECNGVIRTFDNALVVLPSYSYNKTKDSFNSLYQFIDEQNAYFYLAPRTIDAFYSSLPEIYASDTWNIPLQFIKGDTLDDFFEMTKNSKNLYYKTDHHWTTDGAFFAYNQICERMGIEAYPEKYFQKKSLSDDFLGTSFSKSGLPKSAASPDTIMLYRYDSDTDYTIYNYETKKSSDSFYDFDALGKTDKYRVFMGGNFSHLSIRKNSNSDREKLLLIKDSYANSVIPFLALHFDLEVIDPRYCTQTYIEDVLTTTECDRILILVGVDTVAN